jgi:hypothetical protein
MEQAIGKILFHHHLSTWQTGWEAQHPLQRVRRLSVGGGDETLTKQRTYPTPG